MPTAAQQRPRIPVHVLTGFLGSGKTTLLRHFLADPALRDTAVIINEFGEIGLDHLLVREVTEDVILLSSGCLCCTVRDDLLSTLLDLKQSADDGEIPSFSRVAVETTGLADPLPIMQALMSEKRVAKIYRLGNVLTTVDALNGQETIDKYREAACQVAAADRIIVTKTDLVSEGESQKIAAQLDGLNSTAARIASRLGDLPRADDLLRGDGDDTAPGRNLNAGSLEDSHHHSDIATFVVTLDDPISLPPFIDWLELLLANRGDSILRVKGYIDAIGYDQPLVIQGVQHTVYKPEPLAFWPNAQRRSELVFITRDLTQTAIERSIRTVLGCG